MGLRGQWAGICTWGLTCCHHWCARLSPVEQIRTISLSRAWIEAAISCYRFAWTVTVSSSSCNRREKGASSFASSRSICADSLSLPKPGGGSDKASSGSSSSASSVGSSSWACGPAAEEALAVAVEDVAVRLATDRPSSQPREYCVPAVSCLEHPCRQHRAPSLFHLLCETGWPHGMSAGGFCPLSRIASLNFCRHCFQSQSGQPRHWHSNSFCAIWIERWQAAGARRCKQKQCRGQSFLLLVLKRQRNR